MRYLYQQLLAFWIVILVTLVTLGITFTQMTKQTIEENNYHQLFGYADAVVEEINDNMPVIHWRQRFKTH